VVFGGATFGVSKEADTVLDWLSYCKFVKKSELVSYRHIIKHYAMKAYG
jgi:hypothetical protein